MQSPVVLCPTAFIFLQRRDLRSQGINSHRDAHCFWTKRLCHMQVSFHLFLFCCVCLWWEHIFFLKILLQHIWSQLMLFIIYFCLVSSRAREMTGDILIFQLWENEAVMEHRAHMNSKAENQKAPIELSHSAGQQQTRGFNPALSWNVAVTLILRFEGNSLQSSKIIVKGLCSWKRHQITWKTTSGKGLSCLL